MAKIVKNSLINFFVIFVIFSLVAGWFYSGWPRIWQEPPIPPEIQEARADTQAINIQRGVIDVPNTGTTAAPGTNFGSLTSAFVLFKSNRSSSAGLSTPTAATRNVDDLSMRLELTAVNTITATRISTGEAANYRADWESWEYVGAGGGANEFIVRSRNTITLAAGTRSTSESLDNTPTNINKSIPFITGISNTQTGDDSNGLTAIGWISGINTLNIERGGSLGTTIIQVVTVEFTGSSWGVAHGKQATSTADSGTMTLYEGADAETTAYTISSTSNAFIAASQSRGDTSDAATNDTVADNYPATYISSQTQVTWEYDAGHAVTNGNKQYVHVLENPYVTVTRFTNTGNLGGDNNVDITSAGVTDLTNTAIFLSKRSSGTGYGFPRGWASYRITSTTNAAHWVSYSGNTQSARLEIVIMPMEAAAAATVSCSTSVASTDFGTWTDTSIKTSSPNASTTMSCSNTSLGCTLYVKDEGNGSNPGLATTSPAYTIPSPWATTTDATATLSAGIEGYGVQATTTTAGLTIAGRYLQTGDIVGGLKLTNETLASSTADIANAEVIVTHKAAISQTTLSGSYEDTITYSCFIND